MNKRHIVFRCVSALLLPIILASGMQGVVAQTHDRIAYFSAEVPVRSQRSSERASAAKTGLLDVLVRISGTEAVRDHQGILTSAKSAARYIDQYQYATLSDLDMRDKGYKHFLKVRFSERVVRRLLEQHGFRIWSVDRPTTLVWLVEDSRSHGKQFVVNDGSSVFHQAFLTSSQYHGLPISFPLLDFEDQTTLSPESAWRLDEEGILAASERYKAEIVLVGKVTRTSAGDVWSNWEVFHGGRNRVYDIRADSIKTLSMKSLAPLADFLAGQYAYVSGEGAASIIMNVSGVRVFSDYRGVVTKLSKMASVKDVQLISANEGALTLQLYCDADIQQFLKLVQLSGDFTELTDETGAPDWLRQSRGSEQNPLRLLWQG